MPTIFSTYFQSWSSSGTTASTIDLALMDPRIKVITIDGVNANFSYTKGQNDFSASGLSFPQSFAVVKAGIAAAAAKGQTVMLTVGEGGVGAFGTAAPYATFDSAVALANDLGCHGIDIDWEPSVYSPQIFGPLIAGFRAAMTAANGSATLLSAAVWATGAETPVTGSAYTGLNLEGMKSNGNQLDWINIMSYDDGGPTMYDIQAGFNSYRKVYSGHINLGIELGPQGWGTYLSQPSDVTQAANIIKADGNGGVFVWAYKKDTTGSPTFATTLNLVEAIFNPPPVNPTSNGSIVCPNCKKVLKVAMTY